MDAAVPKVQITDVVDIGWKNAMKAVNVEQRRGYISFVGSGRCKYDALLDAVTKLQRAGYSIFGQPLPWLDADETVWGLAGSEGELYNVSITVKQV